MTKISITAFFLVFNIGLFAQSHIDTTKRQTSSFYIAPEIVNNKILNYVFIPDSNTQASLFNIRMQYLYFPNEYAFRRGGLDLTIGLNVARFFSRKIILGVFTDTRLFSAGQTKQFFSHGFVNDFNSNYLTRYSSANDSLRGQVFHDGINNSNGVYIQGSFPTFYGISFSPFPQKWGGFLLEIKKGSVTYDFYGNYDANRLNGGRDNNSLYLATVNNLEIELSFKPYKFFNSKRVKLSEQKLPQIYKFITISICYEKFSLENASFSDQPLNSIVSQTFISKYSNQNYFGVKLGLGLY